MNTLRMNRKRTLGGILALIIAAAAAALAGGGGAKDEVPSTLAEADKLYLEKSYAGALEGYERLLKGGQVPADQRDRVEYQRNVSLGKAQKWDRALEESVAFVKARRGTIWEARGTYWLGRLYLAVPHQGYRVDGKLFRGQDVPKVRGDQAPEQVQVYEQDQRNSLDALEAARVFYPKFRGGSPAATPEEEMLLNFDLIRVLGMDGALWKWASEQKWATPADPSWKIDVTQPYDPKWDAPKRFVYLFEQIEALSEGQKPSPHHTALALFAKAHWLQSYHQTMAQAAIKWENGKSVRIPYPYQEQKAVEPLRELVKRLPEDSIRDQAQYTLAQFLQQEGKPKEALAEYQRYITERPKSKWADDARAHAAEITRRELNINVGQTGEAGQTLQAGVSFRNVKTIHFEVYTLDLEQAVTRADVLNDPHVTFTEFARNFGNLRDARRFYGPLVKKWDLTPKDPGDYQHGYVNVKLPVDDIGAYVVEASVPGIRTATPFIITKLAMVQKIERDEALLFVTDGKNGAPEPGVAVVIKQWWHEGNTTRSSFSRGTTNADGIVTAKLARAPGRNGFNVASFARKGKAFAVTNQLGSWWGGDNPGYFKVYSQTDRSVYRPMQTVYYRHMVTRREKGQLNPAVNQAVEVEVRDSRGQLVHSEKTKTNEFGSVNGDFSLSSGAPLGDYSIGVSFPGVSLGVGYNGANRFRVEEYKKPEFEVSVKPTADRIKLGDAASAQINVNYYFGGPVPNAKVTYRIHRNYYAQRYRFPRPFDFMYRYHDEGDYYTNYRQGPVIKQGDTKTDAQGMAEISFQTAADPQNPNADASYTIDVDVQDASRRVISGSGMVKATRHDVAVFMDFKHGYATKGDQVQMEVVTLNPSDQPISVTGNARVYRQPDTPDGKEQLTHEQVVKTDKEGRAFFKWPAEKGGYYRVAFETKDTANLPVVGSEWVWVNGPELAKSRFLYQQVTLRAQELYYQQGQTAKVLLVTPAPDCTVLLTREVDNEISERRVIRVTGRSTEITIPLTEKDVPNTYLQAVMIRDHQMYQSQLELFVPPVKQFATVSVEADKARYEPGERAKLKLLAKDFQGRPLRTELSVSVTDAALAYIQKDFAPDVRVYYYGDRRSTSVQALGSPGTNFQQHNENDQPNLNYQANGLEPPEGMGQIPDWPGAQDRYYYRMMPGLGGMVRRFSRMRGAMGGFGGAEDEFYSRQEMRFNQLDSLKAKKADGANLAEEPALAATAGPAGRPGLAGKAESSDAAVETRTNFADTAFWTPAVITDAKGEATVEFPWPDNLTQWRIKSIGTSTSAQVGSGETKVTTKKDVLVRLQAPRFFVERDVVTLSANVHNYTAKANKIRVRLDMDQDVAELAPAQQASEFFREKKGQPGEEESPSVRATGFETTVEIPKDGEVRVDWVLRIKREGSLKVKMSARGETGSDAMEQSFPVLVHGVERQLAKSGVLRGNEAANVNLAIDLPAERKPGSSELVVQLNPSLGATMLDALPYLVDYPYGCLEQTLSRFVPCVVVGKTLQDLGYDMSDLAKRAKVIEENTREGDKQRPGGQTVLNSPYTYPKGRPGTVRVAELSRRTRRWDSPVFDPQQLQGMIREGLGRITNAQNGDGGWGWWPGNSSDPYMTSYVLYALQLAKASDVAVDGQMLERGLQYLRARFDEEDNFHRMAFEARTIAMAEGHRDAIRAKTTGRLWENRERLSPYSKALLATALGLLGEKEKAQTMLRNVETTAVVDDENGSANWEPGRSGWWYWWNSEVETNAAVLQAYMAVNPEAKLAPMLVKWLINNRRSNSWDSTKSTAMAVYAMADYVRVNKELSPSYKLTVDFGGKIKREYSVTRENALFFDNAFVVPDELLDTGTQSLSIRKDGAGTLYYATYTKYFSLEEPIRATGNEIFVKRRYYRLVPGTASGTPDYIPLDQARPNPFLTSRYELLTEGGERTAGERTEGGPRMDRRALQDGETLTSGDQIEVELEIEAKNDYEYLAFEDLKPAGCEPVEVRSGSNSGRGVYSYMELRDQKVAFFIGNMPQGRRTLSYRLRAEIPGAFHALPTNGYAMYAPDIRALSDEGSIKIAD